MTENTKPGARGLILPASTELGNPAEDALLPGTVAELQRLEISVQEVAVDGGFNAGPMNTALADLAPKNVYIAGRQEPGSKRTRRRMRRYRTGAEGRISHLKRRYGLDRSRLKGSQGRRIWTEWGILAYDPTPSPSGPGETLRTLTLHDQTHSHTNGRARSLRGGFVSQEFFRGK